MQETGRYSEVDRRSMAEVLEWLREKVDGVTGAPAGSARFSQAPSLQGDLTHVRVTSARAGLPGSR